MAIDYIINYDCIPKQELTTEGIMERIKGEERAHTIIRLFRENGDDREPKDMGFEFTRSTPTGDEETRVVHVQSLLDMAQDLKPYEHHCIGCPANRAGRPFGCMSQIQYPITREAEKWMIDRLPTPDDTLVWLLLKQGVTEFKYDGSSILPLRDGTNVYFEEPHIIGRRLGEFSIDSNQVFEMIFAVGHINPNHGALILLFLNAIDRDLNADEMMTIAPADKAMTDKHPFLLSVEAEEDHTIAEIKDFLHAVWIAWSLNVQILMDV